MYSLPRLFFVTEKHNVIFIVSDTFRRDHLRCYGNNWIKTKYLEDFASKSIIFDRAYCASFPTVPARRDIFTGRYSYVYAGWEPLKPDEVVISEILKKAGILTYLIADTPHFLRDGYNFQRGFHGWMWIRGQENDLYLVSPEQVEFPCDPSKLRNPDFTVVQYLRNISLRRYESDFFVAQTMTEAVKWLERNYGRKGFFLYIDTFDPHEPWDPPRWYVDMYNPDYTGEEVIYPRYDYCDFLTKEELEHIRALYAAEVTLVDRWFGYLYQKIEDMGLLNNTMIIFTTDHGFLLGEHNIVGKSLIREKEFSFIPLYEEIARIPLIIYHPEIKGGKRIDAIVQLPDLAPTVLDFLGVEIPETMEGKSLIPLMEGEVDEVHEFAVSSPTIKKGPVANTCTTVTTKKWSLIFSGKPLKKEVELRDVDSLAKKAKTEEKVRIELYDLEKDPKQEHNILGENLDIARELLYKYIDFLKKLKVPEELIKPWMVL
ncbi:MAG: hypothetical protein DRJ52_09415 [Thermoprotei archaeon]|nr:MAG: hypothetical protein DRJ52_09415 [Thermoprotei archaeon]